MPVWVEGVREKVNVFRQGFAQLTTRACRLAGGTKKTYPIETMPKTRMEWSSGKSWMLKKRMPFPPYYEVLSEHTRTANGPREKGVIPVHRFHTLSLSLNIRESHHRPTNKKRTQSRQSVTLPESYCTHALEAHSSMVRVGSSRCGEMCPRIAGT